MDKIITYREVRLHSLSGGKSKEITVLDKIFYRKLADLITTALVNHTKIKPNSISKISILFSIFGSLTLVLGNSFEYFIISAILFNIYFLLDMVDGSLARVLGAIGSFPSTRADQIGTFYDALAGYVFLFLFWNSLSINLLMYSDNIMFAISGIVSGNLSLLGRLIKAKYILISNHALAYSKLRDVKSEQSVAFKIFKNLEFGGFFGLFLFFLWIPVFKNIFVIFYLVFNLSIVVKALKDTWNEK